MSMIETVWNYFVCEWIQPDNLDFSVSWLSSETDATGSCELQLFYCQQVLQGAIQ